MSGKLLIYFGDDEAYFRALQGEFRRHARVPIDFQKKFASTEEKIQSLFITIYKQRPSVIFIDFSKNTQDYLYLARLISRTPFEHPMVMVGLVDYLSPPEVLKESIATGVTLNFIKSAETYDVIYNVTKLMAPEAIGEHGFATATLKEEWEAGILGKIGYIHHTGIHLETDHPLKKGDRVLLNHHWLEKRIVPSRQMVVQEVGNSNLFYQFKQNTDLEFIFVDEYMPSEGLDEAEIQQKRAEREELVIYHKKQLKKWIDENIERSLEKKAKVLVVDSAFHFYQDQPRADKHNYTVRCIANFNDISQELHRLQPNVIAYELEEGKEGRNDINSLRQLISVLKAKFSDLNPFIIVFKAPNSSKEMQESLGYPQILADKNELSVETLVKLANIFDKKLTKPADPKKMFLKKNNLASLAEIIRTVTVIKLSETDMVIQTDFPFEPNTNLHFRTPVDMFVNLQPMKSNSKLLEYRGYIHCIGETDKKELRRFVNSVFFRDHDAQLQAETDEFKKLNELKLLEKVEAEKAEVAEKSTPEEEPEAS